MKLNSLTPAEGSVKNNFRRGRGQGSGGGASDNAGRRFPGRDGRICATVLRHEVVGARRHPARPSCGRARL